MTRRAVATFAFCLIACGTLAQVPSTPRATGLLAGRVVDDDGHAVANAVVIVQSEGARPRPGASGGPVPVRANGEGRFVFTSVPAGRYRVSATKAGWLAGEQGRRGPGGAGTVVTLAESELRNDLLITMWRPAVIAGTVTDDNGDPLVDVEVRAVPLTHEAGRL